jgi:hypothetical protein
VPPLYGEELFRAAPHPKRLEIVPGVGHDDFIMRAGPRWADAITTWARGQSAAVDPSLRSRPGRRPP